MKKIIGLAAAVALIFIVFIVSLGRVSRVGINQNWAVYAGPGTWEDSVQGIEKILTDLNIPYREVGPREVNQDLSQFKAIVFPGGWAPEYNMAISEKGRENIRNLVRQGGIFVGLCAGAYFASENVLWEGINYPYPLAIFAGKAIGPLNSIAQWPGKSMTSIETTTGYIDMLYFGGPLFYPKAGETVSVLATWEEYWGSPAAIISSYGRGRIFLSGPHPEVSGEKAKEWLKHILRSI